MARRQYTAEEVQAAFQAWQRTDFNKSMHDGREREAMWHNYIDHRDGLELGTTERMVMGQRKVRPVVEMAVGVSGVA